MKKIKNPYTKIPGYNCFGCAPDNEHGLRMEFYEDDDFICCDWNPGMSFQGYKDVLHGGIQLTLMDEIASWVVQIKLKTAGLTSRIETRFLAPVFVNSCPVHLKANLMSMKRNYAQIDVCLYNSKNELCSQSLVTYYTVREDEARNNFFYPGIEHFYDDKTK